MDKFKGVKWQDLIKSPEYYAQQDRETLAPIISRLSSVANKRLRRMRDSGISYSYQSGDDTISGVKKFGAQGKTLGQLRAEYKRLQGFLESTVSTISGRKESYYRAKQRIWRNATGKEREQLGDKPTRQESYREYLRNSAETDLFNEVAKLFMQARNEGWITKSETLYRMRASDQVREYFEEQVLMSKLLGKDPIDYVREQLKMESPFETDYEDEEDTSTSQFF